MEVFEWLSGLKVNWAKSAICEINIEESKVLQMADQLYFKAESLPITWVFCWDEFQIVSLFAHLYWEKCLKNWTDGRSFSYHEEVG